MKTVTDDTNTMASLFERLEPHYWLFGKGRTRPTEPLYGIQVLDAATNAVLAEAEHDDPKECIALAIAALKAGATR